MPPSDLGSRVTLLEQLVADVQLRQLQIIREIGGLHDPPPGSGKTLRDRLHSMESSAAAATRLAEELERERARRRQRHWRPWHYAAAVVASCAGLSAIIFPILGYLGGH